MEALVVLGQVAGLVEHLVALYALVEPVLRDIVRTGIRAGHLMLLRNQRGFFFILDFVLNDYRTGLPLYLRQVVVRLEGLLLTMMMILLLLLLLVLHVESRDE